MSQFLYNHTKYRCDQKLKIYDPNDRSLSGLYNRNLKQAKPLYIKSSYNPPGTYNIGKKNKKMNEILNNYMKDYQKLKKEKNFEQKNEVEIDDETFKNINKKINKLFFKDDIYEEDDLINPDFLIDRFEDEKEDSKKKSLLISKFTELDYENRKNDNYEKNKEEDDNIYDENNKNIVKDGEDDEEIEYNNFDVDKVEKIQKKYRSHCKSKQEKQLKNYYTGFDNSCDYVNFIYLDKNEIENNNIQNIYYKVYSCKNQKEFQKKYNINELYEINAIDNKNLNEDYINSNKKKIANTIFKEYCKQNNIEIQDDNIEEYDNYNFDDVDNKRDFEDSIEDNFDKLKNENNNNKVIEEHVDQISESIPLKNDSLNKPIDEPLEEEIKEEKKEKNEEEEYYFDKEEIQDKPIDERENSKEIQEEKVENREEEEKVENREEEKDENKQKESFNAIDVENIDDENSKGIQDENVKDYEEEKKIENKDNNGEDNQNDDEMYYFDNEEKDEKPVDERNSEEEKINKEIAALN